MEKEAIALFQKKGILLSERIWENGHNKQLYVAEKDIWRCNIKVAKRRKMLT